MTAEQKAVRKKLERYEAELRAKWDRWRPDLKGKRLPGINCSATPEELEEKIYFRWTLWCFDREGILRWQFPVEGREQRDFYEMLWGQSEGAYCEATPLKTSYPKLWCYRVKFYRDGELFRTVWQIPVQAGLWDMLWRVRGLKKGREYTTRVVPKKRDKLLYRSDDLPKTLTQASPIRGDLDGVTFTPKEKRLLAKQLAKQPPPF